jgi:hypothetical protein
MGSWTWCFATTTWWAIRGAWQRSGAKECYRMTSGAKDGASTSGTTIPVCSSRVEAAHGARDRRATQPQQLTALGACSGAAGSLLPTHAALRPAGGCVRAVRAAAEADRGHRAAGAEYQKERKRKVKVGFGWQQRRWRAAERHHPTGRERMGSPTLQTLQEPIFCCFELLRNHNPLSAACARATVRRQRRRWSAGMYAASGCMHGCILLGS